MASNSVSAVVTGGDATDASRATTPTATPNLGRRFFQKRTLISFAVAAVIVVVAFRSWNVTPQQLVQQLEHANLLLYAFAFLVYATAFPWRGIRWRILLNNVDMDAPLGALTITIFLSWFVNCVVPAKLGDVYRAYLMKKNEQLPISPTLGTIFSERIIDFVFLFLLLIGSGIFALHHRFNAQVEQIFIGSGVLIGVIVLVLAGMWLHGDRLIGLFSSRIQHTYRGFSHGTFRSFRGAVPQIVVLTVLAWSAEVGRLDLVTHALGVHIPLAAVLFALAGVSFSLIVPTPGGLGAAEAVLAGLMIFFGVPAATAAAIALLDRVISYWSLVVIGLVVYLTSKRTR